MSHPNREEWIAYLYDECPPGEHAGLTSHIESCPNCRSQVGAIRSTLKQMDDWKVPAALKHRQPFRANLKWGIAAVLMIGFGFGLARLAAPAPDVAALRSAMLSDLEPVLRRQISAQARADISELTRQLKEQRADDLLVLTTALKRIDQIDQQREVDYATLRKELETVALNARNHFDFTDQQLVQLASTTQPMQSPRP